MELMRISKKLILKALRTARLTPNLFFGTEHGSDHQGLLAGACTVCAVGAVLRAAAPDGLEHQPGAR